MRRALVITALAFLVSTFYVWTFRAGVTAGRADTSEHVSCQDPDGTVRRMFEDEARVFDGTCFTLDDFLTPDALASLEER